MEQVSGKISKPDQLYWGGSFLGKQLTEREVQYGKNSKLPSGLAWLEITFKQNIKRSEWKIQKTVWKVNWGHQQWAVYVQQPRFAKLF